MSLTSVTQINLIFKKYEKNQDSSSAKQTIKISRREILLLYIQGRPRKIRTKNFSFTIENAEILAAFMNSFMGVW